MPEGSKWASHWPRPNPSVILGDDEFKKVKNCYTAAVQGEKWEHERNGPTDTKVQKVGDKMLRVLELHALQPMVKTVVK